MSCGSNGALDHKVSSQTTILLELFRKILASSTWVLSTSFSSLFTKRDMQRRRMLFFEATRFILNNYSIKKLATIDNFLYVHSVIILSPTLISMYCLQQNIYE